MPAIDIFISRLPFVITQFRNNSFNEGKQTLMPMHNAFVSRVNQTLTHSIPFTTLHQNSPPNLPLGPSQLKDLRPRRHPP